jgi:hypothetical protein
MNSELHKSNENLEITNKTLEEDLSTLRNNYESLKKRNEMLQKHFQDEKEKLNKKSGMLDWFVSGTVKDENSKLKEMLDTLKQELEIKIHENESVHMTMFENKKDYDDKLTQLEDEIDRMRFKISEKMTEMTLLSEKLKELESEKLILQGNLTVQIDTNERISNELTERTNKFRDEKVRLDEVIEKSNTLISNVLPINEYRDYNINLYNKDYIRDSIHKIAEQIKFFQSLLGTFIQILSPLDSVLESYIERINFIYTNTENKTEHKGFLFSCDRIRVHLFTLQQIVRTMSLFSRVLCKHINGDLNTSQVTINMNIILTLLNHSSIYFELIYKYVKIFLHEERKISNLDSDSDFITNKFKINKDLKIAFCKLTSQFKHTIKKINLIFNFDLEYHLKMINIITLNTSALVIKVNENYFKNFPYRRHPLIKDFKEFVDRFINTDLGLLKENYSEFSKLLELKLEIEYKMFELIKEENKNKYNYPNINLLALRANNESIKKILKDIPSIAEIILNNIARFESAFLTKSWDVSNEIILNCLEMIDRMNSDKRFNKILLDSYLKNEKGVPYEEAVSNKRMLKEMLEKENNFSRDRESYHSKIYEYEEEIRRLQDRLNNERNNSDMLLINNSELERRMKLLEKYSGGLDLSKEVTDDQSMREEIKEICSDQFTEFLKSNVALTSIRDEILSDDVQSGKQRSAFKLTSVDDKGIPLTKFTEQIENNTEVSVLYHQKIIEKFQRYAAKVRNIDIKVLAQSNMEDVKNEYEVKMLEQEKKFKEEVKEKDDQITQLEDYKNGFELQLNYLNSMVAETSTELSTLSDKVRDCQRCNKFIKL